MRERLPLAILVVTLLSLVLPGMGTSDDSLEQIKTLIFTERECYSAEPVAIPVYVSAAADDIAASHFVLVTEGGLSVPLLRLSDAVLIGWLELPEVPSRLEVRVLQDGLPATDWAVIEIENTYQAVTVGIKDARALPSAFVQAAGLNDLWGYYIYGVDGEYVSHLRDFFEPTCTRLADAGFEDVYVTSFIQWLEILPEPRMRLSPPSGIGGISEADMALLADIAHGHGLRLHIMYNAVTDSQDDAYLSEGDKSSSWVMQLFETYGLIMLDEAVKADVCGVDSIVLNWQDAWVDCAPQTSLWDELWSQLASSIRQVFGGAIEFNVANAQDMRDARRLSKTAKAVDSFLISQWGGVIQWRIRQHASDSANTLAAAEDALRNWLQDVARFKQTMQAPVVLEVDFLSTDTYIRHGWCDAVMDRCGSAQPDFAAQAQLYEILLQLAVQTGALDGIVSYKYHWDDPFGPDLPFPALSRMDLSDSIRNKPAEAVIKRWFDGIPGPSTQIPDEHADQMCRIWCAPCAPRPAEEPDSSPVSLPDSSIEFPDVDPASCATLVDDFENALSETFMRWSIDFDSAELHTPGVDPTSSCEISREADVSGNHFLLAAYRHASWLKLRYWGFPSVDVTGYDGIQVTLWADRDQYVSVNLGTMPPEVGWVAGHIDGILLSREPTVHRFPFAEFWSPEAPTPGAFLDYISDLIAIAVFFERGSGALGLDDICFYRASR